QYNASTYADLWWGRERKRTNESSVRAEGDPRGKHDGRPGVFKEKLFRAGAQPRERTGLRDGGGTLAIRIRGWRGDYRAGSSSADSTECATQRRSTGGFDRVRSIFTAARRLDTRRRRLLAQVDFVSPNQYETIAER